MFELLESLVKFFAIILVGKVVLEPDDPPEDPADDVTEVSKNCNKMKMTALLPNTTLISLDLRIISCEEMLY